MTRSRRQRKIRLWRAYLHHCDALVALQGPTDRGHPMRITKGYFKAEGWNVRDPRSALRHGA